MGSVATEEQQEMKKPLFPAEANSLEFAQSLDGKDQLRSFRQKFIIPSKTNIKSKSVTTPGLPLITPLTHVTKLTFSRGQ
jgi:kynureninase